MFIEFLQYPPWFHKPEATISSTIKGRQIVRIEGKKLAPYGAGDVRLKCEKLIAEVEKYAIEKKYPIHAQRLIVTEFPLTKFSAVNAGESREFYLYGTRNRLYLGKSL